MNVNATKLWVASLAAATTLTMPALALVAADTDKPDHVYFIMMENHATSQIIGNSADAPFINQLAHRYAVATNYRGVTHPSLPNYPGCSYPASGRDHGVPGNLSNVSGGAIKPAILIQAVEPAHRESNRPYNHYSLLGTILRLWNLPCLANTCSIAILFEKTVLEGV